MGVASTLQRWRRVRGLGEVITLHTWGFRRCGAGLLLARPEPVLPRMQARPNTGSGHLTQLSSQPLASSPVVGQRAQVVACRLEACQRRQPARAQRGAAHRDGFRHVKHSHHPLEGCE